MNFVPWQDWQPTERATLLFVIRGGEILLIRKKRGLGAGKINGPGGRIEPGETDLEAAIRETREELGITALQPVKKGELHFQFADGYSLHCGVFTAPDCLGEPIETDEAIPLWTSIHAIPYDEMWADDRHWLPGLLEGKVFLGQFLFEHEKMLEHDVKWLPQNYFS
jgi:8-oxo-dGTP diphosphatase